MKSTTSSCPVFSPLRKEFKDRREVPQSLSEFTGLCWPCRQTGNHSNFKRSAIRTCGRPISRHARDPIPTSRQVKEKYGKLMKTAFRCVAASCMPVAASCSQLQLCSSSLSPLKVQAFATLSSNCQCNAGQGE